MAAAVMKRIVRRSALRGLSQGMPRLRARVEELEDLRDLMGCVSA